MPNAKSVSVQVFAGTRGAYETPSTHGFRHLIEHLILQGRDGKLDERLEARGVFMLGRTYRDAMQIQFDGPPGAMPEILLGIQEVLSDHEFTQESVAREVSVMRHEFAQEGDASVLNRAAWEAAFGESGLDPQGNLEVMARATPEQLTDLSRRLFAPSNLVIVASGPLDLGQTTASLKALLEAREELELGSIGSRVGHSGRTDADAFGEVRGAVVSGLSEAGAALVAAYAVAARLEGSYVAYTPTPGQGLVLVGRTDRNNTVGEFIEALDEGTEAALMPIGKAMASNWIAGVLATPSGNSYIRGLLMAQNSSASSDELAKAITRITWPEFKQAIEKFKKDKAVIAVGVGR